MMQFATEYRQFEATHLQNHEGNKDYKCESCGKSFSVARSMKLHAQKIH